jgi:hypothetical protein
MVAVVGETVVVAQIVEVWRIKAFERVALRYAPIESGCYNLLLVGIV